MKIAFVILILAVYLKWILIIAILPFQSIYGAFQKKRSNKILKILAAPYWLIEKTLRGGWARYMIFHVSTLPSHHLRRAIYKIIGATIGEKVVFHYGTQIRAPYRLRVGGVQ